MDEKVRQQLVDDHFLFVSGHKEEVVVDKLLPHFLVHPSERVVGAGKVALKIAKCSLHEALHFQTLLLGNSRAQAKSRNASSNPNPSALNRSRGHDVALDVVRVHVRGVHCVGRDAMVLLNKWVEDFSEVLVAVPISSVDSTMLVVKLHCASNSLGKSEAAGFGLHA